MSEHGSRTWFFPDGDLPEPGDGRPNGCIGHESLVILNPNPADAAITLTVYFPEAPARTLRAGVVRGECVRCIRTNEPVDGFQIPRGQYALKVESTVGVVCQMGRMDVTQPNLAYYTTLGCPGG